MVLGRIWISWGAGGGVGEYGTGKYIKEGGFIDGCVSSVRDVLRST